MNKIDRAINIYQVYSLAKISALCKQSLIAQHAQCEHIRKLEKNLQRELQSVNRINQKILENQIKDAKRAENIKYFRRIAHNCKEGISLIQQQIDPIISLFLLELFEEPFRLALQEAKNNLEDISDLDYCQNWINQLSLTKQKFSASEQNYISSPFHIMLIENKPYMDEIQRLEDMKIHLTNEIGNVPEPNLKIVPTEKEFKSSCGLSISKILVVFCVIMFVINSVTNSHSLASITSLILVFIITPLAICAIFQYFTNKKANKYTEFVCQLKAHNALLQSEYDIKIQSLQTQCSDVDNQISECNCNHQYIIAKDKATKYFNDWQKLLSDVQSFLPSTPIEKSVEHGFGDRSKRDALFNDCARFIVTQSTASTSSLQRRFSIGYNKAGKIMDQLETAGIVGPAQEEKPRAVLMDAVTLESIL